MTAARRPVARARADAASRNGKLAVTLTTDFGSAVFHPLPVAQWRESAQAAARTGDTRTWAEKVLPAKEFAKWIELDPNSEELLPFFGAIFGEQGEDEGESGASTPR